VAAKAKEPEKEKEKATPSKSDVVSASDVAKVGSGSGRSRSLIEEELTDPDEEKFKKKLAQRAQFNPLQPPGFVAPSQGPNWGLIVGIGAAIVVVLTLLVVILF
jgi:hypothetical protein